MDDDAFRPVGVGRGQPSRSRGDEGWVLHSGRVALPCRIDDRQVAVGIRPEPLPVILQRRAGGGEVAVGLVPHAPAEAAAACRPSAGRRRRTWRADRGSAGLVVQAKSWTSSWTYRCVVVAPSGSSRRSRSTPVAPDDPALRHRQPDVVDAEVGEELGPGVELVRVPAGVLEHADFREPLGDKIEIADRAGARERSRHARRPGDLDVDRFARATGRRQRHLHHRPVVGIAVVRRDEAGLGDDVSRDAAARDDPQAGDLDPAPVGLRPLRDVWIGPGALAHPRRPAVAPGVVVEVELQRARRRSRRVAPGEELVAGDRAACRIESRADGVVGVPRTSAPPRGVDAPAGPGSDCCAGSAVPPSVNRAITTAERANTRQSYTKPPRGQGEPEGAQV